MNNSNNNSNNSNNNSNNSIKNCVKGLTACRAPEDETISRQAVRLIESDSDAYPQEWNDDYEKGFTDALNKVLALPSAQPDNSCDGCRYENADDGVLVPCGFCKRSHSDNYERRTDEPD